MIPVGFGINEDRLSIEEKGYLESFRRVCPSGTPLLIVCDEQSAIDECRTDSIPCIAYDPDGKLHHDWVIESLEGLDEEFIEKAYCRQKGIPMRILDTERTYLREISLDDLDALFDLYNGPHTTDFIEPLYEYEEEREYQEKYIRQIYGFYDYGMWLVCDRDTDEIIGRAGIESRQDLEPDEVEMGYVIAYDRRRQGLATEVCKAIIDWTKEHLDVRRISCRVEPDNIASQCLLTKLGFEKQTENIWVMKI